MRYEPGHKDQARARILDAIGRGFRAHGVAIGVDGLAKEASVTSGALYGHFKSKSGAFRAVVEAGLIRLRRKIEMFRETEPERWTDAFADFYLGRKHRDDLPGGCALPSLSADVGRADEETRRTYQAEMFNTVDTLVAGMSEGGDAVKRDRAWAMLAMLAGGVVIARGVSDKAAAAEIASAVRRAIDRL